MFYQKHSMEPPSRASMVKLILKKNSRPLVFGAVCTLPKDESCFDYMGGTWTFQIKTNHHGVVLTRTN
jgi:hypothetical protein